MKEKSQDQKIVRMKPLIAANWKMNKDIAESKEFVNRLLKLVDNSSEIVLFASFTSLYILRTMLEHSRIKLGGQNMHSEEKGTYTGEVSASMLKDAGCEYVILGHSERRQYFHETDETINKKIKVALKNKLMPIVCVGETLEQRENSETESVVKNQLEKCLKGVKIKNVVIAYEPIWAIGTGKTATPEQAEEVHKFIKGMYKTRIIYGGSMKPENAKELLSMPDIDGGLVGGASLDAKSFAEICND